VHWGIAELETRPERVILNIKFPDSTRESYSALKICKARVRTESIEARPEQDTWVKSLFVAFLKPCDRLIRIPRSCIDLSNLRGKRMARV
jgi:hypothetical protein